MAVRHMNEDSYWVLRVYAISWQISPVCKIDMRRRLRLSTINKVIFEVEAMTYHPSANEVVSIKRPGDLKPFNAAVISVSGEEGERDITVEFQRLDGPPESDTTTCSITDIVGTFDPSKEAGYRAYAETLHDFRMHLWVERMLDSA